MDGVGQDFIDGKRGLNWQEITYLSATRDIPQSIGFIFAQLVDAVQTEISMSPKEGRAERLAALAESAKNDALHRIKVILVKP